MRRCRNTRHTRRVGSSEPGVARTPGGAGAAEPEATGDLVRERDDSCRGLQIGQARLVSPAVHVEIFGQPGQQAPGCGFPTAHLLTLFHAGTGLLLTGSVKTLANADWGAIALVTFTAAVGIAALAGGLQGWLFKRTNILERAKRKGVR